MNEKNDEGLERQGRTAAGSPPDPEQIVEQVKKSYGEIARGAQSGCCDILPGLSCCPPGKDNTLKVGYQPVELATIPADSDLGLGCGAPISALALQPGETVLDLGSGGGIDVFLAAEQVGAQGRVIGVDMTPEMIELARKNAEKSGFTQVEFRQGRLEELPVESGTVDAVTSNCVINLVPDKSRVFREVARVLKPKGRLVLSDIVLEGELPEAIRADLLAYVGCVAGAIQREDYLATLSAAGFSDIEVLDDVDLVTSFEGSIPEEAQVYLDRTKVDLEDLRGVVRSVTIRAVR